MTGPPPTTTKRPNEPTIVRGKRKSGQRVVIYGEGGIGKTTLASMAPNPVILDCEGGSDDLDVARVDIDSWPALLETLGSRALAPFGTVVIDSATAVEEMLKQHICKTNGVSAIEKIEYGKGWSFIYEEFVKLLAILDGMARKGTHVIVICHVQNTVEKNPEGTDYGEFQPDLLMQGKTCHLRTRIKSWCNHMLFIKYDRSVDKAGKEKTSGTRTIFVQKGTGFWAKSRTLRDDVPFVEGDDRLWRDMGIKGDNQ